MKKDFKEKDFQTLLCKYIKKNYKKIPAHIGEAKISKGKTVRFSQFQPQQLSSLKKAARKGLYFKLSDASLGMKPADYVFIRGGYLALMFETDKQQEVAYFLDIDVALGIKELGKKSISLQAARTLGTEIKLNNKKATKE